MEERYLTGVRLTSACLGGGWLEGASDWTFVGDFSTFLFSQMFSLGGGAGTTFVSSRCGDVLVSGETASGVLCGVFSSSNTSELLEISLSLRGRLDVEVKGGGTGTKKNVRKCSLFISLMLNIPLKKFSLIQGARKAKTEYNGTPSLCLTKF